MALARDTHQALANLAMTIQRMADFTDLSRLQIGHSKAKIQSFHALTGMDSREEAAFDAWSDVGNGLHHREKLPECDQTDDDSSEGGSDDSGAPATFHQLIDFFEQTQNDEGLNFPVEDWHGRLSRASEGADPADALRAIISLLRCIEARWADFDLTKPTEILMEGSRHGKPVARRLLGPSHSFDKGSNTYLTRTISPGLRRKRYLGLLSRLLEQVLRTR